MICTKNIIYKFKKLIQSYAFVFKEIQKASNFLLWILVFSTLVTGATPVITQYILKMIISGLESNSGFDKFLLLIGIYVFVLLFQNLVISGKEYINTIAGLKLTYNIQSKLINKIKKVKYKTFYSPDFQNSYVTVLQNSQSESSMLVFSTVFMMSLIVQAISNCVIIAHFNPFILIGLIICAIPSVFININTKKKHIKVVEERSLSYRKISYYFNLLTEKSFLKEIRIFGLHNFFSNKRNNEFSEYLKIWKKFSKTELINKFFSSVLPCFGVFASVLWIIFKVTKNECSIADFVFYSGIIFSFHNVFESVILDISQSYKSVAFINKLFDFLKTKNEIRSGGKKLKILDTHTLEFKDVCFQYPYSTKCALKNINFKISTGEQIALVGKNGCGKTTLINLILRIYDPTQGVILLDGVNIKDYNYEEYLEFFTAVFQDYQQYSVKLCDYISFGNIKNSKDISKIKQAALSSTASEFIEESRQKWDSTLTTKFDKDGLELSGGQWQKLAISRAFFSNAGMLLFDEPTSALDAVSESKIYENIQKIKGRHISIFVSHRMYSSKIASKIIYMETGEIKNIGAHEKLMKVSTGYKELFDEQANKY